MTTEPERKVPKQTAYNRRQKIKVDAMQRCLADMEAALGLAAEALQQYKEQLQDTKAA
jgi:hypothetical protein